MEKNMKRYRTFGELLTFIRDHLDECKNEDVYFGVTFDGNENTVTFSPSGYILTLLYSIDQIGGLVVDVKEFESDYLIDRGKKILIKVLV